MAEGDAGNGFETASIQQTDMAATRKRNQPRFRQSVDLTADRFEREAEKLTDPATTEHEIEGVVAGGWESSRNRDKKGGDPFARPLAADHEHPPPRFGKGLKCAAQEQPPDARIVLGDVLQIAACMKADVRARHGNNCRATRVGVEGMSDDLSWEDQPDRSRRRALRRVDAQDTGR